MTPTRANLFCAVMACAWAAGCMAPWSAPPAPVEKPDQPAELSDAMPRSEPESPHGSDADLNLAGVLDKLQQVRAIDPAAEQTLIDELRQTPPESWPLVAEQFRASLAYREQLAAKKARPQQIPQSADGIAAPSAAIGALVESRWTNTDEAAANVRAQPVHLAMQSPLETAAAPADFSSDAPSYPVTNPGTAATRPAEFAADVQQARFGPDSEYATASLEANRLREMPSTDRQPVAEADWQQLVERAEADLSRRVAPSPGTTAEVHQHVSLRLLRLLAGDTEGALEPIPNISPLEQDYWSRQLFALATYLDHHSQPDDKRRAAASVTHLDDAVSHLREIGSLSLRNLSFCKHVFGYGAIEPYEPARFSPGEEISLYVEVENYHSESTEKGFSTLLGSSYELLNEQDARVGGGEFPDVEDCCRSRRRDFHIQYGLTLPSTLAPGNYRLQLVVKDRQSDKIGQASAAFEIRPTRP